jgi:hypothetical protein
MRAPVRISGVAGGGANGRVMTSAHADGSVASALAGLDWVVGRSLPFGVLVDNVAREFRMHRGERVAWSGSVGGEWALRCSLAPRRSCASWRWAQRIRCTRSGTSSNC